MKRNMRNQTIGAFEAKTHLSKILEKVRQGQNFIITKNGEAIAELKPIQKNKNSLLGCDKDKEIFMSDDFNDPLSDFDEYQ